MSGKNRRKPKAQRKASAPPPAQFEFQVFVEEGGKARELRPDEPLPPAVLDNAAEAFAPLLVQVMRQYRLRVADFDAAAWDSFVRAAFGHMFGRAESTERLCDVLERVLLAKLERLRGGGETTS